jgi:hypothetical protein
MNKIIVSFVGALAIVFCFGAVSIASAADLDDYNSYFEYIEPEQVYEPYNSYYEYLEPENNSFYEYLDSDNNSYYEYLSPESNSYYEYLSPESNSYYEYLSPESNSYYEYLSPSGCGTLCGSYGGGSFGGSYGGGYRTGGGYPVMPITFSSPKYPTGGGSSSSYYSSVNTVNTSNTSVTNIDNSINGSFNNYNSNNVVVTPTYTPPVVVPAPYCMINQAQYGSYGYNSSGVYLSWTSTNATSAYLSNVGSVNVNGSQTVYPGGSMTYVLTVYGQNGQTAQCQTTVFGSTYVPPAPYVSLTQIPYTGFDFGTFGNAMYWAGLVTFALGAAYLAIYYVPSRFGAFAFATPVATRRTFQPVVAPKAPIMVEREIAEAKLAPIVATVRKGTFDTMAILASKDGSMPKIVIDRS